MSQSHEFLRRLFGDTSGHIEVRPIEDRRKDEPRGRVISEHRAWYGSVDNLIRDHAKIVETCQANRWAAFFGVLPRSEKGKGTSDDAVEASHVWVDVDFKDYGDGESEARTLINGLQHRPSAMIRSGHGLHLYWFLSEAEPPASLSIMSDAFAIRLRADTCHDAARILRLPGSWNMKDPANPVLVTVEALNLGREYHFQDLADGLPEEVTEAAAKAAPRVLVDSDAVAGLSDRVRRLIASEPNVGDLFAGESKTDGDITTSGYDFAFVMELTWHGVRDPDELVAAVLSRHAARGVSKHKTYPSRTVGKALAKRLASDEEYQKNRPEVPPPDDEFAPPPDYPPDHAEGIVFERGDEAEMADRLLAIYGGQDMAATESDRLYLCNPDTWLWSERTASQIRGGVKSWFSGSWVHTVDKKGEIVFKPVALNFNRASGTARLLVDTITTRGFIGLSDARGVAFGNLYVSLDEPPRAVRRTDWLTDAEQLPFDYDPDAKCTAWLEALRRIWPGTDKAWADNVYLLQEFFGAALFGLGPKFQKVLILVGDGNNGKSVIVKVLEKLFPPAACTSVPIQQLGHEYYNEMLLHSKVNIVGELPARDVLDASAFKGIVDGSLTPARRIREAPISFHPKATHVFSANILPQSSDHSEGFWRRIMALHFERQFKPTDPDYDPDIVSKLTAELPGIARWAIDGAKRLLDQNRYTVTEGGGALVAQWRMESNSVALFADEHIVAFVFNDTATTEIYTVYCDYCRETNHRPVSMTNFGKRFRALGFESRKSGTIKYSVRVIPVLREGSSHAPGPWG